VQLPFVASLAARCRVRHTNPVLRGVSGILGAWRYCACAVHGGIGTAKPQKFGNLHIVARCIKYMAIGDH
jgi:hypothetical protein